VTDSKSGHAQIPYGKKKYAGARGMMAIAKVLYEEVYKTSFRIKMSGGNKGPKYQVANVNKFFTESLLDPSELDLDTVNVLEDEKIAKMLDNATLELRGFSAQIDADHLLGDLTMIQERLSATEAAKLVPYKNLETEVVLCEDPETEDLVDGYFDTKKITEFQKSNLAKGKELPKLTLAYCHKESAGSTLNKVIHDEMVSWGGKKNFDRHEKDEKVK
jgi:hypothetical protein